MKETNVEHRNDTSNHDHIARIHLILLKAIGLVAFDNRRLDFVPTIVASLYIHWSHILVTSMYAWNVGADLAINERNCDVEIVAECVGLCGVHSRFLIMFIGRGIIARILDESRNLWMELTESEIILIRKFVVRSVKITQVYLVANGAMCVFYLTVSQLASISIDTNGTSSRVLPYVFYLDVQMTPWYEITVVVQMLGMIGICVSCSAVDSSAIFFIMLASGHFEVLCGRLQGLEKFEMMKDTETCITECVRYHQKIIKYCKQVEKLTNLLFMVQLLSTTYNMSLIGLKLVGDDPDKFKYMSVLVLLMIQLFMCQWAPDVLVSQSESLAKTAYFVPTSSNDNKKIAKLIHILLMRSQRSIQLTAGGYINLSMECFGSMITNAMSFFTVLRSIN